jgi:tetratricopeptide (TPR) repeat protein
VARLDDIPRAGGRWIPIRKHLDIGAFGINAWVGDEVGGDIVSEHDEENGQEELYFVSSGHATFTLDGEEIDTPAGTLVFVEPPTKRKAVAVEAGTTVMSIGAKAGEAFEVSAWEANAEMYPLYEAGDYEGAAAIIRAALERSPEPSMYYNLACMEALQGHTEEAFAALEPIKDEPRFKEMAADDSDFDSLRDDPRFATLLETS